MKRIGKMALGIALFSLVFSINIQTSYPNKAIEPKKINDTAQSDEISSEQQPEEKEAGLYIIEIGDDME